ncbi:MAG TPA: hypothetical protein PKD49_08170 [Hyphomicrobium sp.]|nr:hypothetical protein [Hyphomicrobium sp.]
MTGHSQHEARGAAPLALRLFCLALMVPACAINGAFLALAIPPLAPYGIPALLVAALIGGAVGVLPARWLTHKIHEGLSE